MKVINEVCDYFGSILITLVNQTWDKLILIKVKNLKVLSLLREKYKIIFGEKNINERY